MIGVELLAWQLGRELLPRLAAALLSGRPPREITLEDLLSDQRIEDLRRRAARDAARRRMG